MASPSKLSLKLLIDKKSDKVLFAEAGKDFVDFLFNLLALPVGTVIRLLTTDGMVGSLGNLYHSVETLNDTYVQEAQSKDLLLKPTASNCVAQIPLFPTGVDQPPQASKSFYTCSRLCHVSDSSKAVCPSCRVYLSRMIPYIAPPAPAASATGTGGGYVKGVVTYMVMDDLEVKPMSTISSITILNQFNIKDLGLLEEKVVEMGMPEGLKLLKASLQTKAVLTSVFLGNARSAELQDITAAVPLDA